MAAENPHLYLSGSFRSEPQGSLYTEPLPSGKSLYRPDTTLILRETHHDTRHPSIVVKQTGNALELYATGETPDSTPMPHI